MVGWDTVWYYNANRQMTIRVSSMSSEFLMRLLQRQLSMTNCTDGFQTPGQLYMAHVKTLDLFWREGSQTWYTRCDLCGKIRFLRQALHVLSDLML
jgi:hypothetical protein